MHFSSLFTSLLAVAPLVAAHGDGVPGAPKIFGRRSMADLAEDSVIGKRAASRPHHMHKRDHLNKRSHLSERANTNGQCGRNKGSCAAGYCCSSGGWCGQGAEYCAAPDCQFNYGPACDANTVPPGTSTSGVSRTKSGSLLYGGAGIYDCTVPNMIALTYDDGPYIYTSQMLDILARYNVKATFFVTGNNLGKGPLDNAYYPWVNIIKRMYNEGHQIASHTWSHQDLSTEVTKQQRLNQMYYLEMAVRNILGVFPTYMRPPYSSCTSGSGCQSDMADLGYHVTYFDLDTEDYLNTLPSQIQTAKNDFVGNISRLNPSVDDALVIAHDIHEQTALNLTEYMITTALNKGWKFGTVGECLNDPKSNWYRSSSGSVYTSAPGGSAATSTTSSTNTRSSTTTSAAASSSATVISQDGSCGGTTGQTCLGSTFGNCCSPAGYCGSDTAYCGTGCQPLAGNCGSNGAGPSSTRSSTTTTSTRSTTSSVPSSTASLVVSPDGNCGAAVGQTCLGSSFGNCCSTNGYCGREADWCGTGCQPLYGNCGSNGAVSSSTTSTTSTRPSSSSTTSTTSTTSTRPSSSSTTSVASTTSTTSTTSTRPSSSSTTTTTTSSSSTKPSTTTTSTPSSSSSSTRTSTTTTTSSSTSSTASSSSSSSSSRTTSSSSTATTLTRSTTTTPTGPSTSPTRSLTTSTTPPAPTSTAILKTTDGKCGKVVNKTCDGYAKGNCCGSDNQCGSGWDCLEVFGCQDKYGFCWF